MAVVAALACISVTSAQRGPASAASDGARYQEAARRAAQRLEALTREAEQLARRERTLLVELRRLEIARDARSTELARIEAELSGVVADRDATSAQIESLSQQVEAARPLIAARLARLYMAGWADAPRVWLSGRGLRESGRAYRLLSALAETDRRRFGDYREQIGRLSAARTRLDAQARRIEQLRAQAVAARGAAAQAAERQFALVRAIDQRRDLAAQWAGELEHAREQLSAAVEDLAAGRDAAMVTVPLRPFQGELDWPARGRVLTRFGQERHPRYGTAIVRNGIGIATAGAVPVRAVHDGRVAFADTFEGFGRLVIVDHGQQAFSLYGYLDGIDVPRGGRVGVGTVIGRAGRSPAGTPMLYFELRVDARPVDPLQWLKAQP